jgi:hypothetical protein
MPVVRPSLIENRRLVASHVPDVVVGHLRDDGWDGGPGYASNE